MTWITRSTNWGYSAPHSIAWTEPPEAPATACSFFTPRESNNALCTRTESFIDTTGKLDPYGFPVSGLIVAGPVVPTIALFTLRLASVSALTTKYRSVSIALPGPMIASQ
jgi:hypothetical protein